MFLFKILKINYLITQQIKRFQLKMVTPTQGKLLSKPQRHPQQRHEPRPEPRPEPRLLHLNLRPQPRPPLLPPDARLPPLPYDNPTRPAEPVPRLLQPVASRHG